MGRGDFISSQLLELDSTDATADFSGIDSTDTTALTGEWVTGRDVTISSGVTTAEYNKLDDIKKALELAIKHIDRMRPHRKIISEEIINPMPLYLPQPQPPTPAQIKRQEAKDLMEEADQIEQCEKDLEFIKSVLQGL